MKIKEGGVVHLNFDRKDHEEIRRQAESLGMPMATLAKAIVLKNLYDPQDINIGGESKPQNDEIPFRRKLRTIK